MGYATIRIPARRVPVPAWVSALSEREFQERLFRDIRVVVRNRVTRAAYDQAFVDYFGSAASDGFRDGAWRYEKAAFQFTFPDHGGSAMSMAASLHFIEVGAAIMSERQTLGWQLQPERNLVEVLNHNVQPLVELGKTLYVIGSFERALSLTTDDGLPAQEWSALSMKDRARLEGMWTSKTCGCQLCAYYRPRAAKAEAKKRVK